MTIMLSKMAISTLFVIFIAVFIDPLTSNKVSSDVTKFMSVREGDSVHLEIQTPSEFEELQWIKNDKDPVVSYNKTNTNIYPNFVGKVTHYSKNFSITLRNVLRNDSGIYKARAIFDQSEKYISQYNVSILDAVSHGSISISIPTPWIIFLFLNLIMIF